MDLLVGDVRWVYHTPDPLTAKEIAEQAALKPKYDAGCAAQQELLDERNACVLAHKPIPKELLGRIKAQMTEFVAVNKKW